MIYFISYFDTRWLHLHNHHNFEQPARICSRDPTLMSTYYELGNNQMLSKITKKHWSPAPLPTTCFCLKCGAYYQTDHKFHSYQQGYVIEIPWL
jgi:hypothetical protein